MTIILHLSPGIVIAVIYYIFAVIVTGHELPNDFANDIAVIIALLPIEVGVLLYVARKREKVPKRELLFPWLVKSKGIEYAIFIPIMTAWSIFISYALTPFENFLITDVFSFVPERLILGNYEVSTYSDKIIILLAVFGVICNGIIAPLVEELYFRGYLLPRIPLTKNKAVILNAVLFSLYQFFSPWYFFSRLFMMIPLYWWVAKKKNIRFSIIAHMIANIVTSLAILQVYL